MMKKNGFTLAEVLITLAIIGVVATLTLPALMTNTGEQQYVTGLKKGINTLTEAAQMNEAIAGFNYGTLAAANQDSQSLYNLLSDRASVDFQKTGDLPNADSANTLHTATSNYVIFFRDGSALIYNPAHKSDSTTKGTGSVAANRIEDDGLPYGIPVIYDVNGAKAPNTLSNCSATPNTSLLSSNTTANDKGDATKCNQKTQRIIRDQFGIRLRGSIAVPNGAAATWAFER